MNRPWRLLRSLTTWHLASQRSACRNAMVSSTALAERRRERQDVEHFLEQLAAGRRGMSAESSPGPRQERTGTT